MANDVPTDVRNPHFDGSTVTRQAEEGRRGETAVAERSIGGTIAVKLSDLKELLYPSLDLPPPLVVTARDRREMERERYVEQLEMAVLVLGGLLFFIWLISRFRPAT